MSKTLYRIAGVYAVIDRIGSPSADEFITRWAAGDGQNQPFVGGKFG